MEIERRTFIAATLSIGGTMFGENAAACSLAAVPRPLRFSDAQCRRQIREWVSLLNSAPSMKPDAVEAWLEERSITLDHELLRSGSDQVDEATFIRSFRVSAGKLDPKDIRLADIGLVRQRDNLASYAFTLRRYRYYPADDEGCNGLFVHDEYWGNEDRAFIASFTNNRMKTLRTFPEWFA